MATKAINKGNTLQKVVPFILDMLERSTFEILVDLAEGVIEGTCRHKVLLVKLFADNWNWGYQKVMSFVEGGPQLA